MKKNLHSSMAHTHESDDNTQHTHFGIMGHFLKSTITHLNKNGIKNIKICQQEGSLMMKNAISFLQGDVESLMFSICVRTSFKNRFTTTKLVLESQYKQAQLLEYLVDSADENTSPEEFNVYSPEEVGDILNKLRKDDAPIGDWDEDIRAARFGYEDDEEEDDVDDEERAQQILSKLEGLGSIMNLFDLIKNKPDEGQAG